MLPKYQKNLDRLKRVNRAATRKVEKSADVTFGGLEAHNLGLVTKGTLMWKLRPLFGTKVYLYHIELPYDMSNVEIEESLPPCVAYYGKAGERTLQLVRVPGMDSTNFIANLKKCGIIARESTKLSKRIRRLCSGNARRSSTKFSYNIITEEDLAPVAVSDGMAYASTKFLATLNRGHETVCNGDTFRFSMITPEGQMKGTVVAMDQLQHDVVIPGLHNVKTEIRTEEKRLFCLEDKQIPKVGRTDIQTIINNQMYVEFEHYVSVEMGRIGEYCKDPTTLQQWVDDKGSANSWFSNALKRDKKLGKTGQKHVTRPVLDMAIELGIPVINSPRMIQAAIEKLIEGINLKKMSVVVPDSCRGYIITDLSQICPRTGEFRPDAKTVLKKNEICFPNEHIPAGKELAVVRQPNAPGEVAFFKNKEARVQTQGIQISPLAADPSMAQYYPTLSCSRISWLELAGGADYDDSVIAFYRESTVKRMRKRKADLLKMKLPPANLEMLIDGQVKESGFQFTRYGQIKNARQEPPITLGGAVNFMMAAVSTDNWKLYKDIAQCETNKKLAELENEYLRSGGLYPSCWLPDNRFERQQGVRLPVKNMGDRITPFSYWAVTPSTTKLCSLIGNTSSKLATLDKWLRTTISLDQKAAINNIPVLQELSRIGWGNKRGSAAAGAINAAWLLCTSREAPYLGEYQKLIDSFRVAPKDLPIPEKKIYFGQMVHMILEGLTPQECIAATALFAVEMLKPKDRWDRRDNKEGEEKADFTGVRPMRNAFGRDIWLFTLPYSKEKELVMEDNYTVAPCLQSYWLTILSKLV